MWLGTHGENYVVFGHFLISSWAPAMKIYVLSAGEFLAEMIRLEICHDVWEQQAPGKTWRLDPWCAWATVKGTQQPSSNMAKNLCWTSSERLQTSEGLKHIDKGCSIIMFGKVEEGIKS